MSATEITYAGSYDGESCAVVRSDGWRARSAPHAWARPADSWLITITAPDGTESHVPWDGTTGRLAPHAGPVTLGHVRDSLDYYVDHERFSDNPPPVRRADAWTP